MFRGKLWKKLLITYLVFTMIVFLVINYPVKRSISVNEEKKVLEDLAVSELYVINLFESSPGFTSFQTMLTRIVEVTGERFIVTDSNDEVLFDSAGNTILGRNIGKDYPDDLAENGEIGRTNLGYNLANDYVAVMNTVDSSYMRDAKIIALSNYDGVTDEVDDTVYELNFAGLMIIIAVGLGTGFYCIHYTKMIRRLIRVTASYADNKVEPRPAKGKYTDEVGELANAIDYLAEKNEGLVEYQKTFIANISHDFRSPLTSIRGYTVAMKDGTIPPESQEKYLDIILFETDRLAGLTQNLLDLNEFDNNAIKLNLIEFNICSMIKQSAATFEAICASKKLKLRLVFADKNIMVKADKNKIQQVFHNLIDNAIKFSDEDSRIIITVSERNDKVYISVRDFGMGIPKESLNQIWERFYKTDLSRGKDKKGTGLGLSITKMIIKAHGENIIVDSKVGEGTEFTFSLPKVSTE